MSPALKRLGEFAFKYKWFILLGWIVVLGTVGFLTSQFIKPTSSAISIPGTAAQQTLDRFNELFPESSATSGRVVFAAPEGKTLLEYKNTIMSLSAELSKVDEVKAVIDPFTNPTALSEDQTIGYSTVQLDFEGSSIPQASSDKIISIVDTARTNGLTVEAGGDIVSQELSELFGVGEIIGVVIALFVLVITLGSLVAAGFPIITALVSVGVSILGLFSLSQVIDINSTTPALAVMLGLAVGIDYSLFIINRYRTFVLEGVPLKEAAGKANATAGNAVVFAAVTVVIALAALSVVQIPFMTTMGLAGAATVVVAALVAITLVPALLSFGGMKLFSRKQRKAIQKLQDTHKLKHEHMNTHTFWHKWGTLLTTRPKTMLLIGVLVAGVIAIPALDLKLGLPTDQYASESSTERKAYDLLAEGFGEGFNAPLLLVVENMNAPSEEVLAFAGPTGLYAPAKEVSDTIQSIDGVELSMPAFVNEDGTKAVLQVIPESAPSDPATSELVTTLRSSETTDLLKNSGDNISLGVTGTTALQDDINNKLANALPLYLAVVVGLSLILLLVAFRSILIPLKATLGFLLSVLAMFGAMVAVFQWGWFGLAEAPGPLVSFIPIIAIGILFGLAMDYEFFLVSGMQEAFHKTNHAKPAVLRGFSLGSKVVTAAAVIMIAVFAGFVGNHDETIQAIGFGLAVGILIDAFVVRMTIVPAVMTLLGKSAWWVPKWLDKLLPNISIEGEK